MKPTHTTQPLSLSFSFFFLPSPSHSFPVCPPTAYLKSLSYLALGGR